MFCILRAWALCLWGGRAGGGGRDSVGTHDPHGNRRGEDHARWSVFALAVLVLEVAGLALDVLSLAVGGLTLALVGLALRVADYFVLHCVESGTEGPKVENAE